MLIKTVIYSILLTHTLISNANELRHQFINPNFGGSSFNGAPLLNNANAQNNYKEAESASLSTSSAESFRNRLDRAIFSRLSRELVQNAFSGEDGSIVEGTIETGLNSINVEEKDSATFVSITDNETGGVTVIEIPNF